MRFALAKWNKLNTHYVIAVWGDTLTFGRLQRARWLHMIVFLYIKAHLNANEYSKYQRTAIPYRHANITDVFSWQSLIIEIDILYFGQACPKACDRINEVITQKIIKALTRWTRLLSRLKMNIEKIWNIHECWFFGIFSASPFQGPNKRIHSDNKCLFPPPKERQRKEGEEGKRGEGEELQLMLLCGRTEKNVMFMGRLVWEHPSSARPSLWTSRASLITCSEGTIWPSASQPGSRIRRRIQPHHLELTGLHHHPVPLIQVLLCHSLTKQKEKCKQRKAEKWLCFSVKGARARAAGL